MTLVIHVKGGERVRVTANGASGVFWFQGGHKLKLCFEADDVMRFVRENAKRKGRKHDGLDQGDQRPDDGRSVDGCLYGASGGDGGGG